MPEIHHFAYGWFNPALAYVLAFTGSFTGLVCTARARQAGTRARRARWLVLGSLAIGGAGIWLMHFMAMLGFDIPASQVRYEPVTTAASLAFAVVAVGFGLFFVGTGRRRLAKIPVGGVFTGTGVVAMHYTGMYAMRVSGQISYDQGLVLASVVIAVVAATVALWFTVVVQGWRALLAASAIMAVAVCGMHYTAMAALRVQLDSSAAPVVGMTPALLIVPIFLIAALGLLGMFVSALQAMTQEEFSRGPHEVAAAAASQAVVHVPQPRAAQQAVPPHRR
ncbi:MAG: histidine kinase [Hamadaea sp.]|nr:histidine kinase [Hamadaea sp.]